MADAPPPPRPPPHGNTSSKLPDGNYDIFIIPPHSSGSGFLYLPSLQPQRNSFLAGVACTLLVVGLWTIIMPALRTWMASIAATGGVTVVVMLAGVGVAGWAWGKTQMEQSSQGGPRPGSGPSETNGARGSTAPPPHTPKSEQTRPTAGASSTGAGAGFGAASGWEKAREETRKREEQRKREDDIKKKKDEAEKAARAAAEKDRWEKARAREKDAREREARERIAKEKEAKAAAAKGPTNYERPTARSYAGDSEEYSFRPYDTPGHGRNPGSSASESSYAASHSTARTTPPPSQRGPYITNDPDKVMIKGVYLFNNMFPKPVSQLVTGQAGMTDGLILRITTEGLFIDDDVRGVAQREWDVKAWSLKLLETGKIDHTYVVRANVRDTDGKKYVFVLPEEQSWKVDVGLQRLRKGSQVRAMGMNGLKDGELKGLLTGLGWL